MNFSNCWPQYQTLFGRWRNMMDRCYDPDCKAYPNYGGRGIKVCDDWHNPLNYVRQLPSGYFNGAHLDRIDNDGDYEPLNVRWVTARENHNNRRTSVMLTFDGRTQSMSQWSRETGINVGTLHTRLREWNWSVEKALTTPPLTAQERMQRAREVRIANLPEKRKVVPRQLRTVIFEGEEITMVDLAAKFGLPLKLIRKRIDERGWSVERAVLPKQR